ncbi:hypothetical protein AMECASPLE_012533 [Ameca splendens]|uniref:Secreted protein n=1 Tax=Ameca splendens TaxID=208324 RepID=A0ABV0ZA02_9TELE
MVLSVFVVLLLTVFFEILKVWRVWLSSSSKLAQSASAYAAAPSGRTESCSVLDASPSESSLTSQPLSTRNRWELVSYNKYLGCGGTIERCFLPEHMQEVYVRN